MEDKFRLRVLGIGVEDIYNTLMESGFENPLISETRDRNLAQKMIEEGKVDVVIYNCAEDFKEIDRLLKNCKNLYVAKTLGWTPKLNPKEIYKFLGRN